MRQDVLPVAKLFGLYDMQFYMLCFGLIKNSVCSWKKEKYVVTLQPHLYIMNIHMEK